MSKSYFLSCGKETLNVTPDNNEVIALATRQSVVAFFDTLTDRDTLMCSSTMDFPQESTSQQWLIDVCNEIRSS